jgi:hypothetical protein
MGGEENWRGNPSKVRLTNLTLASCVDRGTWI